MTIAMQTSDVKLLIGITSTINDSQIAAMIYPTAAFADEYCNFGLSRYVYHRDGVYVTLATSTSAKTITNSTVSGSSFPWLSRDTVVVWSSNENEQYVENQDYEIDYESGTIVPLAGSTNGTSTGGDVLIDFAFIDPTGTRKPAQMAIAQLIKADINNPVGIASESVGPLSRNYITDGIPPQVARILKPFRRPVMK